MSVIGIQNLTRLGKRARTFIKKKNSGNKYDK